MNREEILKMAQLENKGRDEADLDAQHKGAYWAYLLGVALILIVDLVEWLVLGRVSLGCNMALLAMCCTAFAAKYRIRRKKHELFVAAAYGFGAAVLLVMWILQLCGVVG